MKCKLQEYEYCLKQLGEKEIKIPVFQTNGYFDNESNLINSLNFKSFLCIFVYPSGDFKYWIEWLKFYMGQLKSQQKNLL